MSDVAGVSGVAYLNCPMEYECPKVWDDLTSTPDEKIRHCGACDKDVTFCADEGEVLELAKQGACIAFYTKREKLSPRMVLGFPRRRD